MKNSYFRKLLIKLTFRVIQSARIFFYRFISTAEIKGSPVLYQPLHATGNGQIEFSGNIKIGVYPSPFFLSSVCYIEVIDKNTRVFVDDGTWINNNFSIRAEYSFVKIGKRVYIGTGVEIINSNFHGIKVVDRRKSKFDWSSPVIIQDDVFLGSNVRIQKGVTIGYGSVVGNGSVVVENIPSGVIAAGNPAKIIKVIDS